MSHALSQAAVKLLQCRGRGLQAYKAFGATKKKAIVAQERARGVLARRKVAAMKVQFKGKPPRTYALKAQAVFRGLRCRKQLEQGVLARTLACGEKIAFFGPARRAAATALAAAARAKHARAEVATMKVQFKGRPPRTYALMVQATWRGNRSRKQLDPAVRTKALACGAKAAFHTRARTQAAVKLAKVARRRAAQKDYAASLRAFALVNRMARKLVARLERNKLLEAEFRGTLSVLSSKEGMDLIKIASHQGSGFGHYSKQGLRSFRVKTTDGKDHPIPKLRPEGVPPPPGAPEYSLVWKSKGFFGRGGSGVALTQAVQVMRSTPGGLAHLKPTSHPGGGEIGGEPLSPLPASTLAAVGMSAAEAAAAAAAGAGAVTRITLVRSGRYAEPLSAETSHHRESISPDLEISDSPASLTSPSSPASAASGVVKPRRASGVKAGKEGEDDLGASMIIECGDEHTCLRLYRCLVRLGAAGSLPPPVDLSTVKRKPGKGEPRRARRPSLAQALGLLPSGSFTVPAALGAGAGAAAAPAAPAPPPLAAAGSAAASCETASPAAASTTPVAPAQAAFAAMDAAARAAHLAKLPVDKRHPDKCYEQHALCLLALASPPGYSAGGDVGGGVDDGSAAMAAVLVKVPTALSASLLVELRLRGHFGDVLGSLGRGAGMAAEQELSNGAHLGLAKVIRNKRARAVVRPGAQTKLCKQGRGSMVPWCRAQVFVLVLTRVCLNIILRARVCVVPLASASRAGCRRISA